MMLKFVVWWIIIILYIVSEVQEMKFNHLFTKTDEGETFVRYKGGEWSVTLWFENEKCLYVNMKKHGDSPLTDEDLSYLNLFAPEKIGENSLRAGDITVEINPENFLLSFYKDGKLLFEDRKPLAYNFENEFGSGVCHYVSREKDEKIFGLGDKGGSMNKNGRSFRIETTDSMGYNAETSDPLYKHVPFYICENSVGCYGVFYDTSKTSYMDFGREHNNYYEPYKFFKSDGDSLAYCVFFGTKLEILENFNNFTGEHAFPPKWSFDYNASTMAYTDSENAYEEMKGFLEKLKEYDLSCTGFYLSSGYTSIGNARCVFNWNKDKFPNPKEFVDLFKENGIEIIPNIKPAFLQSHPMYDELKSKGFFVKNPDGTPFVTQFWDGLGSYLDFTNPDAVDFWKNQVKEKLLDLGIVSTWNDNNEFDIKDTDALVSNGEKAYKIRPTLTYLMNKASFEAQKEKYPSLRPFLSTRSGSVFVKKFAQTWSGDNYTSFNDLKFCNNIGLTMSMSGFYFYGHDLGGFAGEMPSGELLLRWLQLGVFEPRFTIHSWNADGSATMPWSYPDILPSVRSIFAQRKRLIPYLYNCAYEAVTRDLPINAPVYLYYDDKKLPVDSSAFMLGRKILVSCILDEGKTSQTVYLPEGDDWYLGNKKYTGGSTVNVDIPADKPTPFFIKAGCVLPTDEGKYGFKSEEKTVLTVYPIENGTFCDFFFDDDGKTYEYKNGNCVMLDITVTCDSESVTVNFKNTGKMKFEGVFTLCEGDSRKLTVNEA
jgi:alpha-glucosidase